MTKYKFYFLFYCYTIIPNLVLAHIIGMEGKRSVTLCPLGGQLTIQESALDDKTIIPFFQTSNTIPLSNALLCIHYNQFITHLPPFLITSVTLSKPFISPFLVLSLLPSHLACILIVSVLRYIHWFSFSKPPFAFWY